MKQIGQTIQTALKAMQQGEQSKALRPVSEKGQKILKYYKTDADFATAFNLDNCLEKFKDYNTNEKALKSCKIKLNELATVYSEESILLWIQAWLVSLSLFMNFAINEMQAKTTARLIFDDCRQLNIAEFTLMFKKIIRGDYGVFFGTFNGQIIIQACKKFRERRGELFRNMSSDEIEYISSGKR